MAAGGAAAVLALAFAGYTDEARERAAGGLAQPDLTPDARASWVAAASFADYIDARFSEALVAARRAVVLAEGAAAPVRAFAAAAHALAVANEPDFAPSDGPVPFDRAYGLRGDLAGLDPQLRWLAVALLVEAAFASGQIAAAGGLFAERNEHERPSFAAATFATLQGVRVAIFGGDLPLARSRCDEVLGAGIDEEIVDGGALAHAFLALICAYQGEASSAQIHVDVARTMVRHPRRWVDGGAHIVAAFALAALDRPLDARPLVLSGGGGPDLHLSQLVDRALGYEILVAAAIADGDLDAAELWARRARALSAVPSASVAVDQIDARLALARGDADNARRLAAMAAERARLAGRMVEASVADLARARAAIAAGETGLVVDDLSAVAHDAQAAGAIELRRRAAAELRRLGRRVEPPRGAGAGALSDREREVAELAAEGFTSGHIAQTLFLSERTVQAHLRRAMKALGVTNRASLPAALGVDGRPGDATSSGNHSVGPLTPRQGEVARAVHAGLSNAEIAASLGISVKTVEKYVSQIFDRWAVTTRTGIARVVAGAVE